MSTQAAHIPDAAAPHRSDRRTAWLIVLGIVSVLSVAFALLISYAVTDQNGSDLASVQGWVLIAVVALVPGLLVATTVWLIWRPPSSHAPRLVLLALACVAVVMAGVAGAAVLGGRAYDDRQQVIAAACSADDAGLLAGFAVYGPQFSGAQGAADGTCGAWWILPGENGQQAMASVTKAIAADGWASSDTAWNDKTFTKGSDVVRVTHTRSDEGTTAVSVTVVNPR